MAKALATGFFIFVFDILVRLKWGGNNPITFLSWSISIAFSISWWWTVAQALSLVPRVLRGLIGLALGVALGLLIATNWILYSQFKEYVTAHMLLFAMSGEKFLIDGIKIYIWDQAPVHFIVGSLLGWMIWSGDSHSAKGFKVLKLGKSLVKVSFGLLFSLFFLNQLKYETIGQHKTADASLFVAISEALSSKRSDKLHASLRQVITETPVNQGHPNILLFIGESFGKEVFEGEGPQVSQIIPSISGLAKQQNAIVFQRAYSNSSATDVSLPSLLTGVGPEESSLKLHTKPLIWDWARAKGYHTIFLSPQRLGFSGMNRFLLSPGPDVFMTADKIEGPVVNDNGKDDLLAAQQLDLLLGQAPVGRPVLVVYFSNASHFPFLQASALANPPSELKNPFQKSLWLTDKSFAILQSNFEKHNRSQKLLTIVTADHGELPAQKRVVPRISSFYPEITNIPLIVHFSEQLKSSFGDCMLNLSGIRDLPVQNLDIVPFLVRGLWSDQSGISDDLLGANLCSVFDSDREIVQLNTNEIRQWKPEGFGIVKGNRHYVFSNIESMKLFNIEEKPYEPQEILGEEKSKAISSMEAFILRNKELSRIYQSYR